MTNMTGLGKYQRGLELEAEGLNGTQIAARLGYADVKSWQVAKSNYKRKMEALNARAAGKDAETGSEMAPILEMPEPKATLLRDAMAAGMAGASRELVQHVKEVLKQKPQFAPKAIAEPMPETRLSKLKISVETRAEGDLLVYLLFGNTLLIKDKTGETLLPLSLDEAQTMLAELKELLKV